MVSEHSTINNQNCLTNGTIKKSKVCVVGAGVAGLCAIRHLNTRPDRFEIIAYEQTGGIGGTWMYNEKTGLDDNGFPIHSSMYKNLHTNLPMEIMEYPDFKSNSEKSYVHHSEVLQYLHRYAETFNLLSHINFNHRINRIIRKNDQWVVSATDIKRGIETTTNFDYLMVCTGRYSVPYWPKYDSLKSFQGSVIHSHDYRMPEVFSGKRVAVIGGGLSGVDISVEVSRHTHEVIFINRGPKNYNNMPKNVAQICVEVEEFGPKSMVVRDRKGKRISYGIDAVIFATGYLYNINFMDSDCGVKMNDDGTFDGLFRHFINIENPSMTLFAACHRVLPFAMYHQQLLYYMKVLLGEYQLPSKEEMIMDTEQDTKDRLELGLRPKDRHMFSVNMMELYLDRLALESGTKPLKKVIINLHRDLYSVRQADITGYKRFNYKFISDEEYVATEIE